MLLDSSALINHYADGINLLYKSWPTRTEDQQAPG
jgi:hypothetical protein